MSFWKAFILAILIIIFATLIWRGYQRQIIEVPEEIREFSKVFPLLNLFDDMTSETACWAFKIKKEKVKVPNKGIFKKGYMYKYEDRWVPDLSDEEMEAINRTFNEMEQKAFEELKSGID